MDWPSILNSSPVLRRAALSKEGVVLIGAVRDMRKKLSSVMVEEGLVSKEEAEDIGILLMVTRLSEHLKQQVKEQHTQKEKRRRG